MKRCDAPLCYDIVNMKGFKYRHIKDKLFCCSLCMHVWLAGNGFQVVEETRPIIQVPITVSA